MGDNLRVFSLKRIFGVRYETFWCWSDFVYCGCVLKTQTVYSKQNVVFMHDSIIFRNLHLVTNPVQWVQAGAVNPLWPHLDKTTFIYKLVDLDPVPVKSALKSNKTSWLDQCLSSLFLKVLIVSLSTTTFGRLFHILTMLVQNANFLKL